MTTDREDRIRQRAYELWEREGAPHGREQDHWHQAMQEIEAEDRSASEPAPKASPRKRAASVAAASEAVQELAAETDAASKRKPAKRKPARTKKSES